MGPAGVYLEMSGVVLSTTGRRRNLAQDIWIIASHLLVERPETAREEQSTTGAREEGKKKSEEESQGMLHIASACKSRLDSIYSIAMGIREKLVFVVHVVTRLIRKVKVGPLFCIRTDHTSKPRRQENRLSVLWDESG